MRERLKSNVFRFVLVLFIWLFATAAAVFLQAQAGTDSQKQDSAASSTKAASSDASDYVGAETCKTCHADIYARWAKTAHWQTTLDTKGGPSHQGCEGCHGPGAAHIAGGGDTSKIFMFEKASRQEVNARCLSCHASSTTHLNSANSFHRQNDVSCIDCHSPHAEHQTKEFMLVKSQPELCYSCHLQQKSQFSMPFHHRVNEGLIQCSDCHNAHGTAGVWESDHLVRQVQTSDSGDTVCFKCHKDKQGPFVFPHCSVKLEGCATCHIPHGGANTHMLKYSNVNLLCLQCHTAAHFGPITTAGNNGQPTGFAVMNGPVPNNAIYIQACTICHTAIHGSNFSDIYFR
jgi:DmsE family decaheme c-type cytochrome